jgi:hypothetical protein
MSENDHDEHKHESQRETTIERRRRPGTSRRAFLGAATGIGALALIGRAGARSAPESAADVETRRVGDGDFLLVQNDWGTAGSETDLWTTADGTYGYDWDRSEPCTSRNPNYPQALLGTKPWGLDSGVRDFPIRRGDVEELTMELDVDPSVAGDGMWSLAEEWWLMDAPVSEHLETHTHEILLELAGAMNFDTTENVERPNLWTDRFGNTVDYRKYYASAGTSAALHIFRVRGGMTTGKIDLAKILEFMSREHDVSEDKWLSGIELGTEYWCRTEGTMTVTEFDVTINGRTYTSGRHADDREDAGGGPEDESEDSASDTDGVSGTLVPLYRLYNPERADHGYTSNEAEKQRWQHNGYDYEFIQAKIRTSAGAETTPLYRLYNSDLGDHFYTTSSAEQTTAQQYGYEPAGIVGYGYREANDERNPLYRLYHHDRGDHFYTTWEDERQRAEQSLGYTYEGVQCYLK